MKTTKYALRALALFAGLFISCSNDDNTVNEVGGEFIPVQFYANTYQSRTVYGDQVSDKSWPIYWNNGDAVRIFCYNAYTEGPTSAAYALNEGIGETTGTLTTPANPILW